MAENQEVTQRLVKKGNVILLKKEVHTRELTDRDILTNINGVRGEIDKTNHQLENNIKQKEGLIAHLESLSKAEKDLKHFEAWATERQLSKLKALTEVHRDECIKNTEKEFQYDKAYDELQNSLAKYRLFQQKVARHPKVAEDIAPSIITKHLFEQPLLEDPWKKTE